MNQEQENDRVAASQESFNRVLGSSIYIGEDTLTLDEVMESIKADDMIIHARAKAIVDPLMKMMVKALDDMEQWLGDTEDEDLEDGMVYWSTVKPRVDYFLSLMHKHIAEADDKLHALGKNPVE
jgi:hypothetical protein